MPLFLPHAGLRDRADFRCVLNARLRVQVESWRELRVVGANVNEVVGGARPELACICDIEALKRPAPGGSGASVLDETMLRLVAQPAGTFKWEVPSSLRTASGVGLGALEKITDDLAKQLDVMRTEVRAGVVAVAGGVWVCVCYVACAAAHGRCLVGVLV